MREQRNLLVKFDERRGRVHPKVEANQRRGATADRKPTGRKLSEAARENKAAGAGESVNTTAARTKSRCVSRVSPSSTLLATRDTRPFTSYR